MGDYAEKNNLSVCVCGWYFWPGFIDVLRQIKYRSHIISHRSLTTEIMRLARGIPIVQIDNIGLEWGAYDYYLKRVWDGNSNILFCHDDIVISDPAVFDKIFMLGSDMTLDLVYIFKDKANEITNKGSKRHGSHGRALFMKCSLAHLFLLTGGFYFDRNNTGYLRDPTPEGVEDVNMAIRKFDKELQNMRVKTGVAYYPEWDAAYRGRTEYTTMIEVTSCPGE